MDLIKPGQYPAKIVDYGLTQTKAGKIMAFVKCEFFAIPEQGGEKKPMTLSWYGGFGSEKAAHYTKKTLKELGMAGEDVRVIQAGPESGQLTRNDIRVTVENTPNPSTNEMQSRIKYLNPLRGRGATLDPQALSSLEWVKKIVVGEASPDQKPEAKKPSGNFDDDIPF